MNDLQKIDFHMHSTVSDGTDTPSELLSRARETGLQIFSLTDHDAILGCEEIRAILRDGPEDPATPLFINGVEFSSRDDEGKYHILGYHYDIDAPAIREVVSLGHSIRMKKVRARIDFLKEAFGFTFSKEDLDELYAQNNPGKPHIGNLMIKYGYAESRTQAIREFLDKKSFPSDYVRPEEAIRGILDSGGIPVLAHAAYGSGDQLILGDELEARVKRLMEMGLAGVEAYYSGFTTKIEEMLLDIAARHGLYVTAGSDYHGANKMILLGDTSLEAGKEAAPGLLRFLEAVQS